MIEDFYRHGQTCETCGFFLPGWVFTRYPSYQIQARINDGNVGRPREEQQHVDH